MGHAGWGSVTGKVGSESDFCGGKSNAKKSLQVLEASFHQSMIVFIFAPYILEEVAIGSGYGVAGSDMAKILL